MDFNHILKMLRTILNCFLCGRVPLSWRASFDRDLGTLGLKVLGMVFQDQRGEGGVSCFGLMQVCGKIKKQYTFGS